MLQAKLVVVGGEVQSQEVKLKLPAVIGRGKEATLKVPLALISRRHCEIRERDGRLYIRDLGSLNGTFVNNYKITAEQPLLPGELVTVGTITFRAEYQLQPKSQLRPHASAEPAAQRENSAKTEGGGTGTEEAVVFTPLSPSNGKRSTLATPQFDSTVAGTMSVSVSPGQPVQFRESVPAAGKSAVAGKQRSPSSASPAQQPIAAKKTPSRLPSQANRAPARDSFPAVPPEPPEQPQKIKQPRPHSGSVDADRVLDDFPLECSPQKSISLSALDELAIAGPSPVSFIGDLNFGDQPRPLVQEGVSIDLGNAVESSEKSLDEADSRLDSFLRAVERPAD